MTVLAQPVELGGDLDPDRIRTRLSELAPNARFGAQFEVLASVDSTMDRLAELARDGAPEGTVVLADYQRTGRGRPQRRWLAPPGAALMLSILFRPAEAGLPPARHGELSMAVGLAALDALGSRMPAGIVPALKWPNDVLAGDRKLAGLLAEADWPARADGTAAAAGPATVIVGLGLNVHQSPEQLPEGAISLAALHTERDLAPKPALLDRSLLAAELLAALGRHHASLCSGTSLREAWAAKLHTLGREVCVYRGKETIRGMAESVAEDGALIIRLPDGGLETLHAGDVTLATTQR